MKVHVKLELTDEQRRAFRGHFGRKGMATRDEVRQFAEDSVMSILGEHPKAELRVAQAGGTGAIASQGCTALDHVYPDGPKDASVKCACGKKHWGDL